MPRTRPTIKLPRLPMLAAFVLLLSACGDIEQTSVAASGNDDSARIAALRAQLTSLQNETQRVQDAHELKRLQRAFGYYMEEALVDEVVDLFTEDASFEFGRDGIYRGKERIRAWLMAMNNGQQGLREGQLSEYLQLMPVITLSDDGMSAKARWRNIMMLGNLGGDALWGEGPYENAYLKQDGVWKISKLQWFQTILVPYKGAWGRHEDFNQGIWVSDRLPPDAPPSHDYGSWPTTFLPPFSFTNPVGRYVPEPAIDATGGQR